MAVVGLNFNHWTSLSHAVETSAAGTFKIQIKDAQKIVMNGGSDADSRPSLTIKCIDANGSSLNPSQVYDSIFIKAIVSSTRRPPGDSNKIIIQIGLTVDAQTGKLIARQIVNDPSSPPPFALPSTTGFEAKDRNDGIALILVEDWFSELYYGTSAYRPGDSAYKPRVNRVFNLIGFGDAAWNEDFVVNATSALYSSLNGAPPDSSPLPRNNVGMPMEPRSVRDRNIGASGPDAECQQALSGPGRFVASSSLPDGNSTDATLKLKGASAAETKFPAIIWRGANNEKPGVNDKPNDLLRLPGASRLTQGVTGSAVSLIWTYLSFCSTAFWHTNANGISVPDKTFQDAFNEARNN